MQTGAQRKAISRPKLEKLQRGGNVVVDARDRFAQKRPPEPVADAAPLPMPDPGMQVTLPRAQPRPKRTLSPLTRRVELDRNLAFVLTRQAVDDADGTRCLLFTVIPAPSDIADDEAYLAPYLQRGWEKIFQNPALESSPGAIKAHNDPYEVFRRGCAALNLEDRITVSELRAGGLRFVPDPLTR